MGYRLRRWFEDRLPQEISSGERVVALAIADLAWDDTRLGYGSKFMTKLLHKTGFENEAQIGKVVGKLAGRGIEMRVPVRDQDGQPLTDKRGYLVYAHRGHQRTFRVPMESEFPFRPAPDWEDDEGERSPDGETFTPKRSPKRETFDDERSPQGETIEPERSPGRETNRGERSPARESKVTQAGDPIPNTTKNNFSSVADDSTTTPRRKITDEEKLEFGRFWHAHPKSRAMDKTKTAWADAVLAGADPIVITAAALAYARECAHSGTEFRFIKQSDGWLREHRYKDKFAPEPAPTRKPSAQLPPWCGECADGARAAEREGHLRKVYDDRGNAHPCPKCHPATHNTCAA
ncbi:hypothetical protein [Streptomyces bauhiniae]|uniref:Uncharacterized protein n=1 Tax=Streptomyces bauhiniae TaxID=2340725 RepID=A0A7K3QR85_9ACTN|nr:hypothetical protein [Streptomyces bauhiniae]NEB92408.1 hypothetical protein [Streptomyces bauhiniae]